MAFAACIGLALPAIGQSSTLPSGSDLLVSLTADFARIAPQTIGPAVGWNLLAQDMLQRETGRGYCMALAVEDPHNLR